MARIWAMLMGDKKTLGKNMATFGIIQYKYPFKEREIEKLGIYTYTNNTQILKISFILYSLFSLLKFIID